jgi:hypothetical protein
MELRDLVEILYTARNRFTSIQVSWQYWYQHDATNVILERWMKQQASGSVAALKSASAGGSQNVSRFYRRVWWRKPACWRDENEDEAGSNMISILCDGQWWSFHTAGQTLHTNVETHDIKSGIHVVTNTAPPHVEDRVDDVPLLDPSFLLTSHDLEIVGDTVHAGREAVQVKAVYRKGKNRTYEPMFWSTADEYQLLIDQERGILLRYAAKLAGVEFAAASVEQISFDEPIPDTVFSLSL